MTDPSSLCAGVLKARYYPSCDFWNAPTPRSSSYTWRSILFGKRLVEKGLRWGIGDGSMTKILSDNWIPGVSPSWLRPLVSIPADQTVSSLILEDSHTWNMDLVRTIFDEDTAARILQVPISRHGGADFPSWPHTRFGGYSVKIAYNLARSARFHIDRSKIGGGSSSSFTMDKNTGRNFGQRGHQGR